MAKTFASMISFTENKIMENVSKGRIRSGGQYVVFIREVWFPKEKLTIKEANEIAYKAAKNLGLDPSKVNLGL